MPTIKGIGQTPIDKGFDAGNQVADSYQQGDYASVWNSDIRYEYRDPSLGKDPEGHNKLSVDSGLAYSRNALKGLDEDGSGDVSTDEYAQMFGQDTDPAEASKIAGLIDQNGDGKISAAENLAWTIFADSNSSKDDGTPIPPDGKITQKEKDTAKAFASSDPDHTKDDLKNIYDGLKLEQKESDFNTNYPDDNNNNYNDYDDNYYGDNSGNNWDSNRDWYSSNQSYKDYYSPRNSSFDMVF